MQSYWMRIGVGAFVVFAIGMMFVTLFRRSRDKVVEVVSGSGPLSLSIPFVPFQIDGNKFGTVERVVINRDAPKQVSSIELEVELDDSLVAQGLAGCRLAVNLHSDSTAAGDVNIDVGEVNDRAFFFCAQSDSGLVPFGTVTLSPGEVTVPLLVPNTLAETLRSGDWGDDADSSDVLAQRAESLADHAEEFADSVSELHGEREEASRLDRSRLGDSLRAVGRRRADSVHQTTSRVADSVAGS